MKPSEKTAVQSFQNRVVLFLFLKFSLGLLTLWVFLFGVGVLILRAGFDTPFETLLWGFGGLPLSLALALALALREKPKTESVLALLEKSGHCGGLLVTSQTHELGPWKRHIPKLVAPDLVWRFQKPMTLFVLSLVFLVASFLVPQNLTGTNTRKLDIEREKELFAAQIEVLEKENAIEAPRAESMKKALEEIKKEAKGHDPAKTLESLDNLRAELEKAAKEALESAVKKQENLAKAEKLANSLEKMSPQLGDQQKTEAMELLAKITKKSAQESELLQNGLDQELLEALKDGTLTPEQLSELGEALEAVQGANKGKIAKLVKAKLLKAEDLAECEGECDGEALEAFLKECGCKGSLAKLLVECENPGKGGLTEGPAHAKLDFGKESSEEGAKFKEVQLPEGGLDALKKSQLTAMSRGNPTEKGEKASPASTGALNQAAEGGGAANAQPILPKHKGAVERFFSRPTNQGKNPNP